jgi:hypothetical protein
MAALRKRGRCARAARLSLIFQRFSARRAAQRSRSRCHDGAPIDLMRSLQYVKPSTVDRWFDKKSARFFRLQFNFFAMAI